MNKKLNAIDPASKALLPNFCKNQTILTAILIGELLAVVLTVRAAQWNVNDIVYFAYASLFIQWITLTDIALLCFAKPWLTRFSPRKMMAVIYSLLQIITLVISEVGYQIVSYFDQQFILEPVFHLSLLGSNLVISMVITALAMHYFYIQHQNMRRLNAETEAKIEALQARIRPHFLFNSLNTIANLVHVDPDQAEEAILDLSELFRSSLGKHDFVSLKEEIDITRRYTNIEQLRLGGRLQITWSIPQTLPKIQMPALMLQPLVENAIYHGIEPTAEGGNIIVKIQLELDQAKIEVTNPVPTITHYKSREGNSIALSNVRQRLMLAYGERGEMKIYHTDETYKVILTLPMDSDL